MISDAWAEMMREEVLIRLRNARVLLHDAAIELHYASSSAASANIMNRLYDYMQAASDFEDALADLLLWPDVDPPEIRLIVDEPDRRMRG